VIILSIRTDKPEAELGLYDNTQELQYTTWQAHRQLAETLHQKIQELLQSQQTTLQDVQGIVVYKGPGSFTGLRIGITVANALAAGLKVPIVSDQSEAWCQTGIDRLLLNESETIALPEYGAEPHITEQTH
jgi:tRNA threonylcarbamoyladenosine biosynthesis protein TsaB